MFANIPKISENSRVIQWIWIKKNFIQQVKMFIWEKSIGLKHEILNSFFNELFSLHWRFFYTDHLIFALNSLVKL
jgi:hypothetical protein